MNRKNQKTYNILMVIVVLAVSAYTIWVDMICMEKIYRMKEFVLDTRNVVFASLEDVDTLFYVDHIVIFKRGYDSRENFMNKESFIKDVKLWTPNTQTVGEMDSTLNIDTDIVDGVNRDNNNTKHFLKETTP